MENFSSLDLAVFVGYVLLIIGIGLYVSRNKKGHEKDTKDYFLASKSLPWWAIGSSLIASNISAEQIIGMTGSGYKLGFGIATYEFMAAATLLIVGKFFLPVYLKKGIYTMPEFLESRYDHRVRTLLAVFWLLVYVFVNLTAVMFLGAKALNTILDVPVIYGIIGLAVFAAVYSIYGGLTAVAWTDVVQVVILVFGGIVTAYLAIQALGGDSGFMGGMQAMYERAPGHFDMIFEKGKTLIDDGTGAKTKDAYMDLPGISVLIGAMWVVNLSYWGCNQYITQRALAGKTLADAQNGILFAGYLKLFMPVIVVLPGIAAYLLIQDGVDLSMFKTVPETGELLLNSAGERIIDGDKAYAAVLTKYVPQGLRGLAVAALIAAIVSSLASMINSTSTIFTMDIYHKLIKKDASEKQMVQVGRITAFVALVIAVAVAPALTQFDQAFQFIQEFTGLVSPGVMVIFAFGLFWKKASANGAFWVAIVTLPLSFGLKLAIPGLPFIDRMGVVFMALSVIMILISAFEKKGVKFDVTRHVWLPAAIMGGLIILDVVLGSVYGQTHDDAFRKGVLCIIAGLFLLTAVQVFRQLPDDPKAIDTGHGMFDTPRSFNIGAIGIIVVLTVIYTVFW